MPWQCTAKPMARIVMLAHYNLLMLTGHIWAQKEKQCVENFSA